jgi:nucleotide-binding universal stress UspA family protein
VGSVAYRVVAHSPVPVVVVGPEHAADDRTEVVVGEDGSAHAELAVGEAFKAAVAGSGGVRAVRAWSTPVLPLPARISPPRDRDAFTATEERALEGAVDPWQSRYPSVPVHIEVVEARPVAALAHAARNARLLVVGASGRHGFLHSALGSTAHGLLHRSPCPVMVVRSR